MSRPLDKRSVIKEINKADEAIKTNYDRLEELENKLQQTKLPREKQEAIRKELTEVRKLLKNNKQHLKELEGHNMKSFIIVLFITFISFMVYYSIFGFDFRSLFP